MCVAPSFWIEGAKLSFCHEQERTKDCDEQALHIRTDRLHQRYHGMSRHAVPTVIEWHAAEPHLLAGVALVKITAIILGHRTAGYHGLYRS